MSLKWTREEVDWIRTCGNQIMAEGRKMSHDLPLMFRQRFGTHSDGAVLAYWGNHFSPSVTSEERLRERQERKLETQMLNRYLEETRKREELMLKKRQRMEALRDERLKKVRAEYGGYSVG